MGCLSSGNLKEWKDAHSASTDAFRCPLCIATHTVVSTRHKADLASQRLQFHRVLLAESEHKPQINGRNDSQDVT
jgi:hypothetical protein